jgi:hypothetical protein
MNVPKILYLVLAVLLTPALVSFAQNADDEIEKLPLAGAASRSSYETAAAPLTIAQQRAAYEANQRMYRTEWYNWAGHSPLRPHMNASYMSGGFQHYYHQPYPVVHRIGFARGWYW